MELAIEDSNLTLNDKRTLLTHTLWNYKEDDGFHIPIGGEEIFISNKYLYGKNRSVRDKIRKNLPVDLDDCLIKDKFEVVGTKGRKVLKSWVNLDDVGGDEDSFVENVFISMDHNMEETILPPIVEERNIKEEEELYSKLDDKDVFDFYNKLKTKLEKSAGGAIRIYDKKGDLITSGKTVNETISKLNKLIDSEKIVYVGDKDTTEPLCMISLKKSSDGLPAFMTTLIEFSKNLDPKKGEDREIIYKLKELTTRGIKEGDMKDIASSVINDKLSSVLESKTSTRPSKLYKKARVLTIEDIDSIKKYLKK